MQQLFGANYFCGQKAVIISSSRSWALERGSAGVKIMVFQGQLDKLLRLKPLSAVCTLSSVVRPPITIASSSAGAQAATP